LTIGKLVLPLILVRHNLSVTGKDVNYFS